MAARQPFALTGQAADLIRGHGIASLNADILYGLPHQDRSRISETVQKLLALSPDRVALGMAMPMCPGCPSAR